MADSKISALTELTGANVDITADVLPIVDDSVTTTKKIKVNNLLGAAFDAAGDIIQGASDGVAAKLAIGTASQVLNVNSGATAVAWADRITLNTSVATTSGTAVTISNAIPGWVKRLTLNIAGVSTNGTSPVIVQVGTGGSATTSGYTGCTGGFLSANTGAATNPSDGFGIAPDSQAGFSRYGILTLVKLTGNQWVASGCGGQEDSARCWWVGGDISLGGALDFIRITTQGGSDTFDAGAVSLMWE